MFGRLLDGSGCSYCGMNQNERRFSLEQVYSKTGGIHKIII
jgi:hypothetical protein